MKKQLVVLSAAAMVAAAAVPALAFENEFHGMFRLRANVTNFQAAGLAGIQSNGTPAVPARSALLAEDDRTFTIFEQRARLLYIAKASDDLKLVTHFEIDSSWGDAGYNSNNGRGQGAGLAGDSINFETKNAYLDFNLPSTKINVKAGLQGFSDAYKGIFLFDDVAGAVVSNKFDAITGTAAFLRTYDANTTGTAAIGNPLGKKNVDVYVLDGKFALNKDTTIGASYYLVNDDSTTSAAGPYTRVGTENSYTHTFGLNAAAKLGIVDLDAFALYQTGDALYDFQSVSGETKDLSAYAFQLAAKANLGMATVRGAFLYASGDDGDEADESGAFQNLAASGAAGNAPGSSVSSGTYYSAQMNLLLRNIFNTDSDQALVTSTNNGNHGLMLGVLGADFKVNDKFSATVNVGTAFNAEERGTEDEDYIGTEVNLQLNYKLYPNLTTTLQGAYAMLGDVYDNSVSTTSGTEDPADPYLVGLMLNYTF